MAVWVRVRVSSVHVFFILYGRITSSYMEPPYHDQETFTNYNIISFSFLSFDGLSCCLMIGLFLHTLACYSATAAVS